LDEFPSDKGFGELPRRSAMYVFEGFAALLLFSSLFFILHLLAYAYSSPFLRFNRWTTWLPADDGG
jgi:hypothetical protein